MAEDAQSNAACDLTCCIDHRELPGKCVWPRMLSAGALMVSQEEAVETEWAFACPIAVEEVSAGQSQVASVIRRARDPIVGDGQCKEYGLTRKRNQHANEQPDTE